MQRLIWFCTDSLTFNEVCALLQDGWVLDPDIYDGRPLRLEIGVVYHLVKYEESERPTEAAEERPVGPLDDVVSVISVELNDVDGWLKEGYKVHALYAKTATLIKRVETSEKEAEA